MTSSSGEPQIVLEPAVVFCREHLDRFRATWPAGYAPALLCLVGQALEDPEIQAAAGARVEALSAVLREFGPLCERVPADVLEEIIVESLAGDDRMIAVVRKYAPPPAPKPEP